MAAKNRELQMLQIPESIFGYGAPLEIERDQNAELRTGEELKRKHLDITLRVWGQSHYTQDTTLV